MVLTFHARQRMAEMDVRDDEVQEAFDFPQVSYAGRHQGETLQMNGRITLAVKDGAVLTVLWARREFTRAA